MSDIDSIGSFGNNHFEKQESNGKIPMHFVSLKTMEVRNPRNKLGSTHQIKKVDNQKASKGRNGNKKAAGKGTKLDRSKNNSSLRPECLGAWGTHIEIQNAELEIHREPESSSKKQLVQVGVESIYEEHIGARMTGNYHKNYPMGYYLR